MPRRRAVVRVSINDLVRVWRPEPYVRALAVAGYADAIEILCEPESWVVSQFFV